MKTVNDKVVEKINIYFLCCKAFSRKIVPLMR